MATSWWGAHGPRGALACDWTRSRPGLTRSCSLPWMRPRPRNATPSERPVRRTVPAPHDGLGQRSRLGVVPWLSSRYFDAVLFDSSRRSSSIPYPPSSPSTLSATPPGPAPAASGYRGRPIMTGCTPNQARFIRRLLRLQWRRDRTAWACPPVLQFASWPARKRPRPGRRPRADLDPRQGMRQAPR